VYTPPRNSDYLAHVSVNENSFEALFRDIDYNQVDDHQSLLPEPEVSLGVLVQDIQQATKAPVLSRPSRQQPPKRLGGDLPQQQQRTSLKVVRQTNLSEEQFDISQLDALANNKIETDDPTSPFFDLTVYEVKNSSQTNEDHWDAWATTTLDRAAKENIVIQEKQSFQIVESEIGDDAANSLQQNMNDEMAMLEVPSEILLDFDDITF